MLLSLPILHLARVNPLLLLCNKPALFIQLSAYNLAGAVKLFPLNIILLTCVIRFSPSYRALKGLTFLSFIQNNKRRNVL